MRQPGRIGELDGDQRTRLLLIITGRGEVVHRVVADPAAALSAADLLLASTH